MALLARWAGKSLFPLGMILFLLLLHMEQCGELSVGWTSALTPRPFQVPLCNVPALVVTMTGTCSSVRISLGRDDVQKKMLKEEETHGVLEGGNVPWNGAGGQY